MRYSELQDIARRQQAMLKDPRTSDTLKKSVAQAYNDTQSKMKNMKDCLFGGAAKQK